MLLQMERQGEYYVLRIDTALVEQAGFNETTRLEATVTGSALVIAPVPRRAERYSNRATVLGRLRRGCQLCSNDWR